jgi:hypothetical protein
LTLWKGKNIFEGNLYEAYSAWGDGDFGDDESSKDDGKLDYRHIFNSVNQSKAKYFKNFCLCSSEEKMKFKYYIEGLFYRKSSFQDLKAKIKKYDMWGKEGKNLVVLFQTGLFEMHNLYIDFKGIGNTFTKIAGGLVFYGKLELPNLLGRGMLIKEGEWIAHGEFCDIEKSVDGEILNFQTGKIESGVFYIKDMEQGSFVRLQKYSEGYSVCR